MNFERISTNGWNRLTPKNELSALRKSSEIDRKRRKINNPHSVEIGDEVDLERISGNAVKFYSGCKIYGADTLIMAGSKLGYEAPVTVDNCQIGPDVELKGGYFKQSVFIGNNQAGLGAHVREATILEEQASIAHTVALKQTILFPFVILGSLDIGAERFQATNRSGRSWAA